MKSSSQQRAVGAAQMRNNSSTMPGNERASFKGAGGAAGSSTSENVKAINLPNSKGMNKPPTSNSSMA